MKDFTTGTFKEVIGDSYATKSTAKRVILCCGKIYYDLLEEQQKSKRKDVALIRVEQLAPFPNKKIMAEINKYKQAKVLWVQEEPENMGAWSYILRVFREFPLEIISRKATASPATGYNKVHKDEQAAIIKAAFKL